MSRTGASAPRPVPVGVQFPETDGSRSTSAFGRAVVAAALTGVDPQAAADVAATRDWRGGYLPHFRALVESGLGSRDDAIRIARQGLTAVAEQMCWVEQDGSHSSLGGLQPRSGDLEMERLVGTAPPVEVLQVPVGDRILSGTELSAQLERWVDRGAMEPSAAAAVREVAEHPEWLSLPGRTLVALGAGAEVGPLGTFLSWGATVAAVDLPRSRIWERVLGMVEQTAGTVLAPRRSGRAGGGPADLGVDLVTELPELMAWLDGLALSRPVLGNFLYADGGTNVRVAAAGQALARALQASHPETTLGFLATPTDVFGVPQEAVDFSIRRWEHRAAWSRGVGGVLGTVSGRRLLQPNYTERRHPAVVDSLVPQQGPNYALGKRIHRWQASIEWASGRPVSMNVAPSTRTRSVTKNGALAAAFAGAHHYGVEVFEPDTTRVLMAALLVHDLNVPAPRLAHPWEFEAYQATHGGLWRGAYAPRSALGLAAGLGLPASLKR